MHEGTYGNVGMADTQEMTRDDGEEMNIYGNAEIINTHNICTGNKDVDVKGNPASPHTGSERVKIRIYRAATLCLVLLCVLLLTAVIVLCVLINTNNHQLHNLTEERNQLLTNNTNLTEERDQLLTKTTHLTEERNQLLTNNTNLTEERDQLLTKTTNELWRYIDGRWILYQSSFYFISSEKKSWSESRSYCRERGADLMIINNREEQDFVKSISGRENIWIGLSDRDKEGSWKWVDGSTLTPSFRFWQSGQPDSAKGDEDCVVSTSKQWADYPCTDAFKWICEKRISK